MSRFDDPDYEIRSTYDIEISRYRASAEGIVDASVGATILIAFFLIIVSTWTTLEVCKAAFRRTKKALAGIIVTNDELDDTQTRQTEYSRRAPIGRTQKMFTAISIAMALLATGAGVLAWNGQSLLTSVSGAWASAASDSWDSPVCPASQQSLIQNQSWIPYTRSYGVQSYRYNGLGNACVSASDVHAGYAARQRQFGLHYVIPSLVLLWLALLAYFWCGAKPTRFPLKYTEGRSQVLTEPIFRITQSWFCQEYLSRYLLRWAVISWLFLIPLVAAFVLPLGLVGPAIWSYGTLIICACALLVLFSLPLALGQMIGFGLVGHYGVIPARLQGVPGWLWALIHQRGFGLRKFIARGLGRSKRVMANADTAGLVDRLPPMTKLALATMQIDVEFIQSLARITFMVGLLGLSLIAIVAGGWDPSNAHFHVFQAELYFVIGFIFSIGIIFLGRKITKGKRTHVQLLPGVDDIDSVELSDALIAGARQYRINVAFAFLFCFAVGLLSPAAAFLLAPSVARFYISDMLPEVVPRWAIKAHWRHKAFLNALPGIIAEVIGVVFVLALAAAVVATVYAHEWHPLKVTVLLHPEVMADGFLGWQFPFTGDARTWLFAEIGIFALCWALLSVGYAHCERVKHSISNRARIT